MRPMRPCPPPVSCRASPNQRFPSGPTAIPKARMPDVASGKRVTTPVTLMRPMNPSAVNQSAPSGPDVIVDSLPQSGDTGYSVIFPVAETTRTRAPGRPHSVPRRDRPGAAQLAEKVYPNLIYFHEADKGGHFA